MITIPAIRSSQPQIVVLGNHSGIIQSILDFDYLVGKRPSVRGIFGNYRGVAKYFWGRGEILIPVVKQLADLSVLSKEPLWFVNLTSGRRTLSLTRQFLEHFPQTVGGALFAENVPEEHAQELHRLAEAKKLLFFGPASIGLLIPGVIKLGPIGGVTPDQLTSSGITESGHTAVISASGGMTNELINVVRLAGQRLSLAFSTGGDRFPMPTLEQAIFLAETDPQTKLIIYYGELGGVEEYDLIKLKHEGKLTKPMVIHIAGTVADLFPESPQFGHAKAKAASSQESALAKRRALQKAGFLVSEKFADVLKLIVDDDK